MGNEIYNSWKNWKILHMRDEIKNQKSLYKLEFWEKYYNSGNVLSYNTIKLIFILSTFLRLQTESVPELPIQQSPFAYNKIIIIFWAYKVKICHNQYKLSTTVQELSMKLFDFLFNISHLKALRESSYYFMF